MYFRYFVINLPLKKGLDLHLNKLESLHPLWQVSLKQTTDDQKSALEIIISFLRIKLSLHVCIYNPWAPSQKDPLRQVWLKIVQLIKRFTIFFNSPQCILNDFKISSVYFCCVIIKSPWKRPGPIIWISLNPRHPGMLYAKFRCSWPPDSGDDDIVKILQTDRQTDGRRTKGNQKLLIALSGQVG